MRAVVRASGVCRVRVRVRSVRARVCRETTGPGPGGVKRHRLGIGTVDGRSLWTGVWLCGRAEEGQRPVTAHGRPRCPLWQPCAGTGRCHHWIIGTMTPWAHALRVSFVESVGCCDTNTFPKTKTLLFHLTPYRKIRPHRSKNTQDPGSPLPSDRFSVWACTSRNLGWRIAFLKVFGELVLVRFRKVQT